MMIFRASFYPILLSVLFIFSCYNSRDFRVDKIDRHALVSRHNVKISEVDTLEALSVGNGEFAFTVDVTGLQSFPELYESGMTLGTQSQWAWHSFANIENYKIDDVAQEFESCNDRVIPIANQHRSGRAKEAGDWLRTNPHRLHLGLVGLHFQKDDGSSFEIGDLKNIDQQLDLWTGKITSKYLIEGHPVQVELVAHQQQDQIAFKIESPLLQNGSLKISLKFPYGNDCHTCPGYDWNKPDKHDSNLIRKDGYSWNISRRLDSVQYFVSIFSNQKSNIEEPEKHHFIFSPEGSSVFEVSINFNKEKSASKIPDFAESLEDSKRGFEKFWSEGGAIDFSNCTDPRAHELERRVVLSQYLTKVNCAGSYPPQETGLTCNSWYGKFHLEMHWWHGVHFALWNRLDLLEKSLPWYSQVMAQARRTAEWQGFKGVRWQKMTGPGGRISPSSVGEFLAWQQPHPLYFAELIYRQKPIEETLKNYRDIVFETADFMASFAQLDTIENIYHLCHPLIPAQEIFRPMETDDPPFELAYWYYALNVAQEWRKRLGMDLNPKWQDVLDRLASLPKHENLYLPCARAVQAYTDPDHRRDHPIVLGAYGMLPGSKMIDTVIMANTFEEIVRDWNWQTTWGWDYPMLAMSAARLGKREQAIDALLMDVQKNTYLLNGHNYQDKRLRLYLPGNGGLLTAVAMMAAGWDDTREMNPGFPTNGKWDVRWENLEKMP